MGRCWWVLVLVVLLHASREASVGRSVGRVDDTARGRHACGKQGPMAYVSGTGSGPYGARGRAGREGMRAPYKPQRLPRRGRDVLPGAGCDSAARSAALQIARTHARTPTAP